MSRIVLYPFYKCVKWLHWLAFPQKPVVAIVVGRMLSLVALVRFLWYPGI